MFIFWSSQYLYPSSGLILQGQSGIEILYHVKLSLESPEKLSLESTDGYLHSYLARAVHCIRHADSSEDVNMTITDIIY